MFPVSGNGEMFGEGVLHLGMIGGAVFLLLATVWTSAVPQPSAPQIAARAPATQAVASAHPGRVS